MNQVAPNPSPRFRWLMIALLVTCVAGGAGLSVWSLRRPSVDVLVGQARQALYRGEFDEARRLAAAALDESPVSVKALVTAGEVEQNAGDTGRAIEFFRRIQDDGSPEALEGLFAGADLLIQVRRFAEAEAELRRVLAADAEHRGARQQLAFVLTLAGRAESAEHYLVLIRQGVFNTHELALLGNPEDIFENPENDKYFAEPLGKDRLLRLAAARKALHHHESTRAAALLLPLAGEAPHDLDVQAALGLALVESAGLPELDVWESALPQTADPSPSLWNVRGRLAQRRNQPDVAIRCYWEAVRRDPNQWWPTYQLGILLNARGEAALARPFQERAVLLNALLDALFTGHIQTDRADLPPRIAQLCEKLGRPWEAWGWYLAAVSQKVAVENSRRNAQRIEASLTPESPQTLPTANPALAFDLGSYPLPAPASRGAPRAVPGAAAAFGQISFADRAGAAGLDFTYDNGDDPATAGMPMRASTGGGVVAFDYDGDLWPDLHLTQGGAWPPGSSPTPRVDRLFRNLGNGRVVDVTAQAGVGDDRFSQGGTAGDYDNDGFADLYVANIGTNRLYHNQGDGTFREVTFESGIAGERWTTSCLMADLNGDGLPDIFDVTYLAGREPLDQLCRDERMKDELRACAPLKFPAENDVLYLNRGDGTFENVSGAAGVEAPEGKGLGVVAADFDRAGRLDLFVANDTTANFLFVNRTPRGGTPTFEERAILAGSAYDETGRAQACMGIAVDDADGDGLFDLYITNFYNEYNTLYRRQAGELFFDASGEAGLKEPSLKMLGFGTQFLDADLDGSMDLVVVNGHIDDFSQGGIPFRMRPQLYHNLGGGRFAEADPRLTGKFFETPQLGRGVARLDFNGDGRDDFAVSHLDSPAALVVNTTEGAGGHVALWLRGVKASRDAVGALIEAKIGARTIWKQLTAGDGYQACNERRIVIGTGRDTRIDELTITWPSGKTQSLGALGAPGSYLVIEGHELPVEVRP